MCFDAARAAIGSASRSNIYSFWGRYVMKRSIVVIFILLVCGCGRASNTDQSKGATIVSGNDATQILPGHIAPNPSIQTAISQRDLTDPNALFDAVENALRKAPSATVGWSPHDARSAAVDQLLKNIMPLNGKHLIKLQCGLNASLGQSFFKWNRLKGTLSVTLPQFRSDQIKLISSLDSALTQTLIQYYNTAMRLPDIANTDTKVINNEMHQPLERLDNEIKILGGQGVEYKISTAHSLVVKNSGIDSLGEETALRFANAQLRFLKDILSLEQGGFSNSDWLSILRLEGKQWESFPPGISTIIPWSNWYAEVPYHRRLEDVCLIVEFRDLYPPMMRPSELYSIFFGTVEHQDQDLFGEISAWYLADRHSGKIIHKTEITEPSNSAQ